MITFLSSAKPFVGSTGDNQVRAIRSWMQMDAAVDVILYGRSAGAEDVCRSLGISYVPDIESSMSGVPYFNAIAAHASKHAKYDLQVYLNCDIIFSTHILENLVQLKFPRFLVVGQRINLADDVTIDISNDYLKQVTELYADGKATLQSPDAMDYFIFKRGMWHDLKPLIIGRAGYDSALIAHCLRSGIPVIDGTLSVLALHQYHDYGHIKGGVDEITNGREASQNKRLHGIQHNGPNTADANWILLNNALIPVRCRGDFLRYLTVYTRFKSGISPVWILLRVLWRILVTIGLYTPPNIEIQNILDFMNLTTNPSISFSSTLNVRQKTRYSKIFR